ncbi:MAG: hypothetical protein N3A01_00400 [Bacteroidales bacterium]|nr:hypothetical protein [Bacteroidales bacterium]
MRWYFLFIVAFLYFLTNLQSKDYSIFRKELKNSIVIKVGDTLLLNAENCEVNFNVWAKHELSITIAYEVYTKKPDKGEEYLSALSNIIEQKNDKVIVEQKVEREKLDNSFKTGKSYYKIVYNFYIPVYLNLFATIKHGNIILEEISGKLSFNISNSELTAKKILNNQFDEIQQLKLSYSKATINKLENAKIILDYSSLNIIEAINIELNSLSSDITINEIKKITLISKYDKVNITNCQYLNVTSNYSTFNLNKIKGGGQFIGTYSNIKIFDMFIEEFNLNLSYSDCYIMLNSDVCCEVNSIARYSNVSFPKKANINNYISINKTQTEGTIGCKEITKNVLNINADYSGVKIDL